jgi:hypothetical protein
MAQKFITRDADGALVNAEVATVSTGSGSAGNAIGANSSGHLDTTWLPPGVGEDVEIVIAAENLSAGDFVNYFSDAGVFSARRADNSNGRQAEGFVTEAVAVAGQARVFHLGEVNSGLSGLTIGARYWLGTAGGVIAAPLANSATGKLSQYLGRAKSATEIVTVNEPWVRL